MIIQYSATSAFRSNGPRSVCLTCLLSAKLSLRPVTRKLSTSIAKVVVETSRPKPRKGYFFTNGFLQAQLRRGALSSMTLESSGGTNNATPILPHRRRQTQKASSTDEFLPDNSSTKLTNTAFAAPRNSLYRLIPILLSLSKPRLTILVVLTACASYSLYPVPELLLPSSTTTPSLSPLTLLFLASGTTLCAASANAFNMLYEPRWDALMSRTRNRPLVRGLISTRVAVIFAILGGLTGTTALYYGVNPTVSFLGLLNIALYAGVYTPLKRISVINTWVGALVGGVPPLMGWAAAAGQSATNGDWQDLLLGEQNMGGWLLAGLLFAWQFPHFMSLSWSIREEYKKAGYRMLCWVSPAQNSLVALRYSLLFFPICIGLCYYRVTEWSFVAASAPVNLWLLREAVNFWRFEGAQGSARGLFWASVWHLPVVMILAMVEKRGMWQRVWRALVGEVEEEDEEDICTKDIKSNVNHRGYKAF